MYAVREVEEGGLDPLEYGLVVPLPGFERDTVVLEDRDGADVTTLRCKGLRMQTNGEKKPFLKVGDISAQLFVTDCRLAFACSKFDKGGGWVGGVSALALNAGSKVLAANRRRGKMLVGHIRYPWIQSVYAQNHVTFHYTEKLRIVVKLPGDESWTMVDFELPKDLDATALGAEIVRRAARFRLAHEPELGEEERAQFVELANIEGIVWEREQGKLAGHSFKTHWPVGEKSSRIGIGAGPAVVQAPPAPEPISVPEPAAMAPEPAPPPAATAEPPAPRFCGACGAEHGADDRFCGACGSGLEGSGGDG